MIHFQDNRIFSYWFTAQYRTRISSTGLRCKSGMVQSSVAYPTGIKTNNFSFAGRPNSVFKAGPQLSGVVTTVLRPAHWMAVNNIPVAIDTDISL